MKKINGFTLLELLVVISVVSLISVSAVGLFYQTLRSGTKTTNIKELDQNAELSINIIEQQIRNAKSVVSVGSSQCPATGSTLTVAAYDGRNTQFSLSTDKIASNGGVISADSIKVSNLSFTCTRQKGVPDQIGFSFTAQLLLNSAVVEQKSYTRVVNLRNY